VEHGCPVLRHFQSVLSVQLSQQGRAWGAFMHISGIVPPVISLQLFPSPKLGFLCDHRSFVAPHVMGAVSETMPEFSTASDMLDNFLSFRVLR